MIDPKKFISFLRKKKIDSYYGVPDSLLKNLTSELCKKKNYFISANEGTAVSSAAGAFLKNKKPSLVFMQNSGLGNAINPLTSLASAAVYSIPMILLIGWRGEPNIQDEPQHEYMGSITLDILKILNIPYVILDKRTSLSKIYKIVNLAKNKKIPVAIIVKAGTFSKSPSVHFKEKNSILRYDFLSNLVKKLKKKDRIFSTTGYTSRELNHLRLKLKNSKGKDFYLIGSMGHAASIASAYSFFEKKNNVYCLDGDGSMLMHMGSLAYIEAKNFKYILLNNFTHESVGFHKTASENIDFKNLSKSLGFNNYLIIKNKNEINKKLNQFIKLKDKTFLDVRIMTKSIQNLNRPKNFIKLKNLFIKK